MELGRALVAVLFPHHRAVPLCYGTFRTFINAIHGARASPLTGVPLAAESPKTLLTEQPDPVRPLGTAQLLEAVGHQGRPRHVSCGTASHDPVALWINYIKLLLSCIPGEGANFEHCRQLWEPVGLQILTGMAYVGMAKSVVHVSCTGQMSSRVSKCLFWLGWLLL